MGLVASACHRISLQACIATAAFGKGRFAASRSGCAYNRNIRNEPQP